MSRLRRLKERKRKNKIKVTTCSLALALAIGSAQGLTTYAMFTDTADVDSNIAISTGDLDVKIDGGLNVNNLKMSETFAKEFKIENKGTLKQKVKLTSEFEDLKFLDYIDYNLEIKTSNNDKVYIDNEGKLFNAGSNSRLILIPGDYLNCTSKINIKQNLTIEQKNELSEKEIKFNLKVLASQINFEDDTQKGFTDEDIQNNYVKIEKLDDSKDLESNLGVEIFTNGEVIHILTPPAYEMYPEYSLELVKGTGAFQNIKIKQSDKPGYMFFIERLTFGFDGIDKDFSEKNQIKLKITFKDKNLIPIKKEEWNIQFRIGKNGKLEARYDVLSSHEIKSPNTEVESLDESHVVEQQNEELEVSEEEIVIPEQIDIIAPKQEIDIQ